MRKIKVFDTTLRDGQQASGANMTIPQKVEIAKLLEKLKVDIIEVGFPISSNKEFKSVSTISKTIKDSKVCSLARHNFKDVDCCIEAMKYSKNKRLHLFIATSPIHMKYKLNIKPHDILEAIKNIMQYSRNKIDDIEWSCEDGTRSDQNFIIKCFETAIKYGARTINIADTVGYTTPFEMSKLIKSIFNKTKGIEKATLSIHCHNDLGLATSNSLQSILSGANQVECTINGLGERAGNAALEEIVMALRTRADFFKCKTQIDSKLIMKISNLVARNSGFVVNRNKPIVGKNAFAHESGIHQHGVLQKRETYEVMDPKDVGQSSSIITLGSHSGLKGIKHKLDIYKINYKNVNLKDFCIFFKNKVKNLKIVDKGLFLNLFAEFKKNNIYKK